ncbi:MAG: hypothetical protein C6I00_07095 [Nitratiruptor sp.]|nr:hypothetical protein [Nitratiruptor sp.]NPA83802.1 hypothetical protein [Campylobacterota bacterium]
MRLSLLILPLWLLGAPCSKCELNKAEMVCNFYVAQKADRSKAVHCKEYADYLDSTKVYGKAAWYYLLGLQPKRAVEAAKRAVQMGESYAKEYMALGYWLVGEKGKAREVLQGFKANELTKRDREIIERLYNTKINLEELR